jgi:hypothetical protein
MALTHELFPGSDHRLEGFAIVEGQFRIFISQRLVDPVPASAQEIADFFTGATFQGLLQEAWYRAADNIAIFNTVTTNVVTVAGRLFPLKVGQRMFAKENRPEFRRIPGGWTWGG